MTTKEDPIRAEFEIFREEFESSHEDWKYADTKALWFWFYKACAESYEKKLLAAQLHIKELRECLLYVKEQEPYSGLLDQKVINAALAKQPDTRALDKALLEAMIEELTFAYGQTKAPTIDNRIGRYEEKLAELNKE